MSESLLPAGYKHSPENLAALQQIAQNYSPEPVEKPEDVFVFLEGASQGQLFRRDEIESEALSALLAAKIVKDYFPGTKEDVQLLEEAAKKNPRLYDTPAARVAELKPANAPDENVLKLLDEPEVQTTYIDLGCTDNIFYYGFTLEGKEAILTSNRKVLRNTLKRVKIEGGGYQSIGENQILDVINYSGYLGDIAPTLSRKAIKEFIISDQKRNPRQVYEAIKAKIEYYMDFSDRPEIAAVETCWVMATHSYPIFHWFPHILFNAPSESGKTKNANVMLYLSFRGFDLGASAGVTPAQIFRTLEGNRGTILIDEFEKNEKSETQMLVNQILNASASRDAYVIRTEQVDKKWRAWKFPIFCPKIVCNITGINPTSMSRFIAVTLLKTLDSAKSRRKPESSKEKAIFPALRDSISLLMLQEWQKIKFIYENEEFDLTSRDADNWQPLFAIAKWLGEDVLESVTSYVKTYKELRIESNDLVENLFRTIYENVAVEPSYYTAKQLAEWMGDELSHQKSPASWVGWRMKQYYFKPERKDKGKSYFLSKAKVADILKRYFGTVKGSEDVEDKKDNKGSEDAGKNEPSEPSAVLESSIKPTFPLWDARALVHLPCKRCGKQPCNFDQVRDEPVCFECWHNTSLPKVEEAVSQPTLAVSEEVISDA